MGLDEMESYRELILENIDYDILLERNPWDKDLLDGYVELMLEICCSTRESVRICGQEIPTEVVKSRFLKLNSEHIGYVMDSLKSNTAKIGKHQGVHAGGALQRPPSRWGNITQPLVATIWRTGCWTVKLPGAL